MFNGKNVNTNVTTTSLTITPKNLALYNPWNFEQVKYLILQHYAEYRALVKNCKKHCYSEKIVFAELTNKIMNELFSQC